MCRIAILSCFLLVSCELFAQDNPVNPMDEFGTTASNVFFYYEDVDAATTFYKEVMGFHVAADYGFAKIMQVAPKSFITLVDHTRGMHSADEPKTTATDASARWSTSRTNQPSKNGRRRLRLRAQKERRRA